MLGRPPPWYSYWTRADIINSDINAEWRTHNHVRKCPTQAANNPRTIAQSASQPEESGFWAFVWLGISLAGGLFGLLLALTGVADGGIGAALFGASLGFFVGFLFAGIVAAPVVLVMAIASWAIRIEWWRALLAVIAGGATGALSTLPIATADDPLFSLAAIGISVPLAALLGSMGAGIAAVVWTWRMVQMMHAPDEHVDDAEAPVTNRFFRIAVLVAVIAIFGVACFGAVCLVRQAREEARRNHCRNNLRQIALCLHSYEAANGSLPPAYLIDKAGKPVLSWRVAAAPYCFYNREFSKCTAIPGDQESP